MKGLGRINGVCTVCPANTHLVNGTCSFCQANAVLNTKGCECKPGFIMNSKNNACVPCNSLNNTFLMNGYCVRCPYK